MPSWKIFHRKLPLNDMDSTPYDVVFAVGVCKGSFSKIIFHNVFSHEIPMQSMDSYYLELS